MDYSRSSRKPLAEDFTSPSRGTHPRLPSPSHSLPPAWRSWLPRLLLESVLIVFSVLLALSVDAWRDERQIKEQVQVTRSAFAREVRENLAVLTSERILPYHRRVWAHYRVVSLAVRTGNTSRLAQLDSIGAELMDTGIHPAPLRDAVWRSFSTSDLLRRMDPAELLVLSDIYREQEALLRLNETMFAIWMLPFADRDHPTFRREEVENTRSFMADVVAAEERLVVRYEEALLLLTRLRGG